MLALYLRGYKQHQIADTIHVSQKTVWTTLRRCSRKYDLSQIHALVDYSITHNLRPLLRDPMTHGGDEHIYLVL